MPTCARAPRKIVATSEADLAAVFEGLPGVERVETGREDGTGNWAFDYHAEEYAGHAYANVHLKDDENPRGEAYRAAEDAGHVVEGVGHHHISVREGRPPLPENRHGMTAWDSLREGDRFTVGMSVEHEAVNVMRDPDDPETVRRVEAIPAYRLDNDNYDADEAKTFNDATINRRRRVQRDGSSVNESDNVKITAMHGEFVIPDE